MGISADNPYTIPSRDPIGPSESPFVSCNFVFAILIVRGVMVMIEMMGLWMMGCYLKVKCLLTFG